MAQKILRVMTCDWCGVEGGGERHHFRRVATTIFKKPSPILGLAVDVAMCMAGVGPISEDVPEAKCEEDVCSDCFAAVVRLREDRQIIKKARK